MAIDFKALGAKAAEQGVDMTKAQAFTGGDYVPPAEGPCGLRFVGYVEVGVQTKKIPGKPDQDINTVYLGFEVSGPNHPPKEVDGKLLPHMVWISERKSLSDKANFFKLFGRMNYAGKARHMAELLGDPYMGRIVHRKYKKAGETDATASGIAVELRTKDEGYTISPPRRPKIDEATGFPTGEFIAINVPPAITPVRGFLWDYADLDQWASIFIDGEYPAREATATSKALPAKSKNLWQLRIRGAKNFAGSPIAIALAAAGQKLDLPDALTGVDDDEGAYTGDEEAVAKAPASPVAPLTGAAADDALAGVV